MCHRKHILILLSLLCCNPLLMARGPSGSKRIDMKVEGRKAFLMIPKTPAAGNPWVWRARFPGFHKGADNILLKRGFHIAYINTGGMLGSPRAMAIWDTFYDTLIKEHKLAPKVALEGVSRGGLFIYAWAARHPDRVHCIYADTPVCDIKSWPLGQGIGKGDPKTWQTLLKEYQVDQAGALAYKKNPIDLLEPIAKAGIPLLHIVSLNDLIVPPKENTFVLAERYRKLGGSIEIIEVEKGNKLHGHHFTHPDPKRVADFIEKHSTSKTGD